METNKGKNPKKNTAVYVTVVLVLAVIAIITAIFGSLNREDGISVPITDKAMTSSRDMITAPPTARVETEAPAGPSSTEPAESNDETDAALESDDQVPVDAEQNGLPQFIAPVNGVIMNEYSESVPVFSETMNDYRTHTGVDISVGAGEAVCAAADGVIGAVWQDPMMGTCMTIVHDGGAVSTYCNLDPEIPNCIAAGVSVASGQTVAAAGESALEEIAEESHLHYELSVGGVNVNPAEYISFAENESDFTE